MLILITAGVLLIGCATSGNKTGTDAIDAGSGASVKEENGWEISLTGKTAGTITQYAYGTLKESATGSSLYQSIEVERKGTVSTYRGIPLYGFIAQVDGSDSHGPSVGDRKLWEEGYDITLTAADGYSITFSTTDIPYDALFLCDMQDGELREPIIIGKNVSTKYWVENPVSINCALGDSPFADTFALEVAVNGGELDFSRDELKKTPYYVEGRGGYTTSAGTYYEHTYGGVGFADFLRSFVSLSPEDSVTVVAMDGYEMTYGAAELMDTHDGTWILAFSADGELLPEDPGYIRTIKIANDATEAAVPNIDGHSSARMVQRIEVSAEVYRDFSLLIKGKMESVLDRSTLQAGINCTAHKTTVSYFNKKSGESENYTGMPLYALLAYGDDSQYAPHKQTDKSVLSYDQKAAAMGYKVRISAADGYAITLDSRDLDGNHDVILAMYQDGKELSDADWPLKLVWDQDAELVPEGIKAVRNVVSIELLF